MAPAQSPQRSNEGIDNGRNETGPWCPGCGSTALDESLPMVEAICTACGVVIENLDAARTRPANLTAGSDEDDEITWADHYTVQNSTEQQVAQALEHLEDIGDRLGLNATARKQAAEIYAEAAIANVTDGRPARTVVAAAAVVGARATERPRPSAHVADVASVPRRSLDSMIRVLHQEVDLPVAVCKPGDYLPFLCHELALDVDVAAEAQRIADHVDGVQSLTGKHPLGIAGAVVYLAADGAVTQHSVATVAGVTGETIRVRVNDCRRLLENQ